MKSVLISMQGDPNYLIETNKKTLELRKTRPLLTPPFKVHIYESLGYKNQSEDKEIQHKYELAVAEREANIKGFTEALEKAKIDAVIKFSWKLEQLLCHTYRSEFSLDNEEAENKVKKAIAYLEEKITKEGNDVVKSE